MADRAGTGQKGQKAREVQEAPQVPAGGDLHAEQKADDRVLRRAPRVPAHTTGLRGLWGWMRPYRARLAVVLLGLLLTSSVPLALGPGLGALVDAGLREGAVSTALVLSAVAALALVMVVGTWLRYYNISWIGERVAADIRRAVFDRLVGFDIAFFDTREGADLQSRFTADTALLQGVVGSSLSMATRNSLMCLGAVALLFFYSPAMAAITLGCLVLCVLPLVVYGRRVKRLSSRTQSRVSEVGAEVHDTVANIKVVHAFNRQGEHRLRFGRRVEDAFDSGTRMILQRTVLITSMIATTMGGLALLLWYGLRQVQLGALTPGQLVSFLFLAVMAGGAAAVFSEVSAEMARALGAVDRLGGLLQVRSAEQARVLADVGGGAAPDAQAGPVSGVPGGQGAAAEPVLGTEAVPLATLFAAPPPLSAEETELPAPSVQLRDVHFRYPARPEVEVLRGLDMQVPGGGFAALVGISGAGKSTLFDLLLRLYEADSGSILLDGQDIREMPVQQLRRLVGLVRQDSPLLRGTVRDNLLYANPAAGPDELERACRDSRADVFIRELPQGLDTPVGEGGRALSGGQRQRLTIARTLLARSRVLLLDEATSNLDAQSEAMIRAAVRGLAGRCTLIAIAHRLSTVRDASLVYFMQAGRIAASGTHAQLMESSPEYRSLAELQLSSDNEAPPVPRQQGADGLVQV